MNLLKYIKILESEICPCDSGIMNRDFCKNKVVKIFQTSKKQPEVQVMEMMRKSIKRCCMHPEQALCKGKTKESHALE